ncbi:hypothetical protein [Nocardia sp. NBC_00511]|uniref:hypothetical protein n=1 Tax=Nocardia sp. NBC_00511 TaxID=2903591 RepID=UPI0030E03E23
MSAPGREGGPMGFLHGPDGLYAIGDDGFPLSAEELLELEEPTRRELERYAVIDIEP